jgi:serine/threonine protein kinase
MLAGLHEVHESGITHQDLKSPNYLVGEGGYAMVSDFGLSGVGQQIQTKRPVDNPLWLAPEVINDHKELSNLVTSTLKVNKQNLTPIEVMREQFKGSIPDEDLEKILKDVQQSRENRTIDGLREQHGVEMKKSSDTWALGVTAHQAWFGDDPFGEQRFLSKIESNYLEFMKEGKPVFEPKEGKELTPQEDLVNRLMDPNPESRLSPKQALEHEVFTDERVGSERIREFLSDPIFKKLGGEGSSYQLTNEDRAKVKEALDKYLQGA